ncbi:hypothetical protein FDUTEX481_01679 [Tolypothrix sp. PCC 7601]|nr:hypothetical protein FDUTEX481_01679 [Tolypothrix sp. PCC 7601]
MLVPASEFKAVPIALTIQNSIDKGILGMAESSMPKTPSR